MKKLLSLYAFIFLNCTIGFSQLPNFAIGMRYDFEYEMYDTRNPNTTNGLKSNAVKQQDQRNSFGFSMNYTLKKRVVLETGVSWIKRDYDQVRAFQSYSTEYRMYYTHDYSYDFVEIPVLVKFYLAKTTSKLKPFVQLGGKASYLKQANYTELDNINYTDHKNTYWGWSNYGGLGIQYFWKNFIFETNMTYQFNQKFKHDSRFMEAQWIKFTDNTNASFSFGGAIYRQLDFRKTKKQ